MNAIRILFFHLISWSNIKYLLILIAIINILFGGNSAAQVEDHELITIPIKEAIDRGRNDLELSDFVEDDIEYIQLETNAYCPIDKKLRLYLKDSVIIAIAEKQIFLFERNTGKFIREIGHVGKDPHGYSETIFSNPYSESKNTILTRDWLPNSFMEYDLSGKFISKRTLLFSETIRDVSNFNDNNTIAYVWNYDGKKKKKLVIFNSNGKQIFSFPQTKGFEYDMDKHGLSVYFWEGWFYSFRNQTNFYEFVTDTIYAITPERLIPRYALSYGKYKVPYEIRYSKEFKSNLSEYYFIKSIYESERFLFFTFSNDGDNHYSGIYDKREKLTKVARTIKNDIDDSVPFEISSINKEGEVIGYQQTYVVKEWLQKHPEKEKEFLAKVNNYSGTNMFYNPIIMIGKVKSN